MGGVNGRCEWEMCMGGVNGKFTRGRLVASGVLIALRNGCE